MNQHLNERTDESTNVRLLFTETKNLILFNKPSIIDVVIGNESKNSDDNHAQDLIFLKDKSEIFMKDEATQTLYPECIILKNHKSTVCGK